MKSITAIISSFTLSFFFLCPNVWAASSSVNEDNGATNNGFQNQSVWHQNPNVEHPAILTTGGGTAASGWDFSSSLTSLNMTGISFISVTLTLQDGNSASGDFDFNHLFLYVGGSRDATTGIYTGGVNTGIVLNGFRGAFTDTFTFSLNINPATTGNAILTQLNANGGRLPGFIVTDNTADTPPNGNQMFAGNSNIPSDATTTLTLSGIPEPGTVALMGIGLLLVVAPQIRRFRRNR